MRIRALRPHTHVLHRGDEHWSGGVVWRIDDAIATLRIRVEASMNRDYTVPTASLPDRAIGAAVVVSLTGAFPYTIAEIRGSHFAGGGDGDDQPGKIARGEFIPAVVPFDIRQEHEEYDWTRVGG